ncbi:MAG: DUF2797 domain-containing protein [Proteobacteria bacterium]|nr:DUF2797 domain-containing protein [Pseudomonadota bacterium]
MSYYTATGSLRLMNSQLLSSLQADMPLYPDHNMAIEPYYVSYILSMGSVTLPLLDFIGSSVSIEFLGSIECVACQRRIKKTFGSGYCFVCFRKLAQADMCMVKPETCHYVAGSCRNSRWGESHCMISHSVYLAVSSGLKVGITRSRRKYKRWVDQGAVQALELGRLSQRLHAGRLEVVLKKRFNDRTRPLSMLKASAVMPWMDLHGLRESVSAELDDPDFMVSHEDAVGLVYPFKVHKEHEKLSFISLAKNPCIEGIFHGIKGQYWIIGSHAFSLRKHMGYGVKISFQS